MIAILKNTAQVSLRLLEPGDEQKLLSYFNSLSSETKKRFGPHPFDAATVLHICSHLATDDTTQRYIAEPLDKSRIVAYMLVKQGVLAKDAGRLLAYGIATSGTEYTFARSIADDFQSSGLGSAMFNYIIQQLPPQRIILWGGVQASNERAVNYYTKLGFYIVGRFSDHNGDNFDMIREPFYPNSE